MKMVMLPKMLWPQNFTWTSCSQTLRVNKQRDACVFAAVTNTLQCQISQSSNQTAISLLLRETPGERCLLELHSFVTWHLSGSWCLPEWQQNSISLLSHYDCWKMRWVNVWQRLVAREDLLIMHICFQRAVVVYYFYFWAWYMHEEMHIEQVGIHHRSPHEPACATLINTTSTCL